MNLNGKDISIDFYEPSTRRLTFKFIHGSFITQLNVQFSSESTSNVFSQFNLTFVNISSYSHTDRRHTVPSSGSHRATSTKGEPHPGGTLLILSSCNHSDGGIGRTSAGANRWRTSASL